MEHHASNASMTGWQKLFFSLCVLPKVDQVIKSCKEPVSLVNLINIHTLLFKYKFISRAPSIGIQCS